MKRNNSAAKAARERLRQVLHDLVGDDLVLTGEIRPPLVAEALALLDGGVRRRTLALKRLRRIRVAVDALIAAAMRADEPVAVTRPPPALAHAFSAHATLTEENVR